MSLTQTLRISPVVRRIPLGPRRVTMLVIGLILLAILVAPGLFSHADPSAIDVTDRLQPPSGAHWFGTDEAGRDLFTRQLSGARVSIGAVLLIVGVAAAVGTFYGAISGWAGGKLDYLMMRVVDVFLSFPYLVLAMAVAASIGRDLRSAIIALGLVWWPSYARLVRGQVLSLKHQTHVQVARTLGAGPWRLLGVHVIPHTLVQVRAKVALDLGYALLALTGLSFLGLGAQNPSPEWGLTIANAKGYFLNAWWYMVLPGLVLFAVVLYFNWVGDELDRENS